jgi:hypothetical protein
MSSSSKQLAFWMASFILGIFLFANSHTFSVVRQTFYYGAALLTLLVLSFWVRLRKKDSVEPRWLRIVSVSVLFVLCSLFATYVVGVATWYE